MEKKSVEEKIILEYLLEASAGYREKNNEFNISSANFFTGERSLHDNRLIQMEQFWNEMDCTRTNSSYRTFTQGKNLIQKANVFIKRVIRRLLRWYIEPICLQQTNFNNSVTRLSGIEIETFHYLQGQITELVNQLNASKENEKEILKKLEKYQKDFESNVQDNIKVLEQKNQTIEEKMKVLENQIVSENEKAIKGLTRDDIPEFENLFFQQNISVSQAGEDRILATLLYSAGINYEDCTYIDIGANYPIILSNTYYFYKLGARGVLIEANPDLIPELKKIRNRDIILNRCIALSKAEEVDFYIMNKDGLSTVDKKSMERLIQEDNDIFLERRVKVNTITVNEIIEKYLKTDPTIINIDIEGIELEVLKQLDFVRYRPFIIIVENIKVNTKLLDNVKNEEINEFMKKQGYIEYAFTGINSIFVDNRRK